jgi:hypothetical protein
MTEYGPSTYGDRVAELYDRMPQVLDRDTERAIAMLADKADVTVTSRSLVSVYAR